MLAVSGAFLLVMPMAFWRYSLPPSGVTAPEIRVYAGTSLVATVYPSRRAQTWVPLDQIPRSIVDAVVAAEDRRFWSHPGIDLRAVGRAARANLQSAERREGGSTISQQLARTLFLENRRSWSRKIREASIALLLEARYSKARILEAYLNSIYLGHDGNVPVHGLGAASQRFFGKDLGALEIHEAAWLAGAIRAPNLLLDGKSAEARRRRDTILTAMRDEGRIEPAAAERAMGQPLRRRPPTVSSSAPYFVDVVAHELIRRATLPASGSVNVQTTLDVVLQRAAEAAVRDGIKRIERLRPALAGRVQAAVVVIAPASGEIRVVVGGRGFRDSPFNRATRAIRQPGSLFKPFVYLAAFEAGHRPLTPASILADEPLAVAAAGGRWEPKNMDGQFHGPVTVRRAVEESLNIPAVRVGLSVGVQRIADVAHALGIEHALAPVPSLALGTSEVTLLEMTTAFAALANGGWRVTPTVLAPGGDGLTLAPIASPVRAVSAESAFLTTHLLRGVMRRGTGAASAAWGLSEVTAGKTGTTDELRDAWFVGYTPDLVVGVWAGLDDGTPLGLTGAQAALPIWAAVMQAALRRSPASPFTPPAGVVLVPVDRRTGRPVSFWCGSDDPVREAFREDAVPRAGCDQPAFANGVERVMTWFRRLMR